jgi:hypothetical protein
MNAIARSSPARGPRWRRRVVAASALLALSLLAPMALAQPDPPPADLPVTRLVATTSGLATFEHAGTVTGTQELVLRVPEEAMNDLLQSLVLQDLDGGTIRPVRYDARDPLARILASYAFDLRDAPGLAELLAQARGETLEIEGPEALRGTLLSVERQPDPDGPDAWYLTLAGEEGLTRLPLAEVRRLRFVDEALQAELDAALAALARERGADESRLRLVFEGEGERRVRVAYVREMPVWKTSYRLVVGDGEAELQGWAILDNPTDMDLQDVEVTFLAGRPVSFVTELFDPVYVERPRVQVETGPQVVPEADAGAFAPEPEAQSLRAAPSPAESADAAFGLGAAPAAPELAGAGVEAMAQAMRTGSAYAYRVDEPVSVGRYASAMVPIVQATVPALRTTVVDPASAGGTPFRAVRIENASDALLAAGTVTLYDEAGFAGNARLADLAPGGDRLLRFAADLGVRVEREQRAEGERVVEARLEGGLLVTEVRQRQVAVYRLARDDDEARRLVIEHPAQAGWEVVSPEPAPARSEAGWRFGVLLGDAEPDPAVPTQLRCDGEAACELELVLERVDLRRTQIANLAPDRIAVLLENVELSRQDRQALERIAEIMRRVADLDTAIAAQQARRDDIHQEQARIRENMRVLDRDASLYRRYLSDLEEQEDELDVVLTAIERFREERRAAQERLNEAIRELAAG